MHIDTLQSPKLENYLDFIDPILIIYGANEEEINKIKKQYIKSFIKDFKEPTNKIKENITQELQEVLECAKKFIENMKKDFNEINLENTTTTPIRQLLRSIVLIEDIYIITGRIPKLLEIKQEMFNTFLEYQQYVKTNKTKLKHIASLNETKFINIHKAESFIVLAEKIKIVDNTLQIETIAPVSRGTYSTDKDETNRFFKKWNPTNT